MYFYKLTQGGKTVFATTSEGPLPSPPYEQITQGEYEEFTGEPFAVEPPAPTVEELEAENHKLRAQVGVLQTQQSFLEECVLEMADVVYA